MWCCFSLLWLRYILLHSLLHSCCPVSMPRFIVEMGILHSTHHHMMQLVKGLLYRWTEHSAVFFWKNDHWGREKGPPKLHPGGGFFGPWSFTILKNSHQDSSNEGSTFFFEFTRSFTKIEWVCVALIGLKALPTWTLAKSSVPSIYIVVLGLGYSGWTDIIWGKDFTVKSCQMEHPEFSHQRFHELVCTHETIMQEIV